MSLPITGVCRYCGCTEEQPCQVPPFGDDDTCCWLPGTDRTVCSAPGCVIAWHRAQKLAKAARVAKPKSQYAGWGYGAVVEDMRRKARRKRGKDRAA